MIPTLLWVSLGTEDLLIMAIQHPSNCQRGIFGTNSTGWALRVRSVMRVRHAA